MVDTKLSSLITSSDVATFYYGIDSGNTSAKFADLGFYNVKNWGAVGDGLTNDTSAIQAAIDAALIASFSGGTIYFPPGNYLITAALTLPGTNNSGLRFEGCGVGPSPQFTSGAASVIIGDVDDYLLKVTHTGVPGNPDNMAIGSIANLGFVNNHSGTITTTEVTPGCVYLPGGQGVRIEGCSFLVTSGIGLFSCGQNCQITGTNFSGTFGGSSGANSIGAWIYNGYIGNCKLLAFGTAIIGINGSFVAENIDIEVSGCGFRLGSAPVDFWDPILQSTLPAATSAQVSNGSIRSVNMESIGDSDSSTLDTNCYCASVRNLTVENCLWANFAQNASYGLYADGANESDFRNLYIRGLFDVAIVKVGGQGNLFHTVRTQLTGGTGSNWVMPNTVLGPGTNGNTFEYCDTDGGMTMNGAGAASYFPLAPTSVGQTMLCTDSPAPAWTGTVSNIGMPVSAALLANGVTAPSTNILYFASIPPQVAINWNVYNVTNPNTSLGGHTTVTGSSSGFTTTVTISPNTGAAGVAIGDVIAFVSTAGTNQVLVRWRGSVASSDGAWCIAG